MKKAKSRAQRRRTVRNVLLAVSMMMMLMIVTVGGTVAWLTATSQEVTNVFTTSDISIELTETQNLDLKMVPGTEIDKDPKVTVKAGSEPAWVFVKITEKNDLDKFITYDVITGEENTNLNANTTYWNKLEGYKGVYYCQMQATTTDVTLPIIGYTDTKGTDETDDDVFVQNKVLVNGTVTKTMLNNIDKKLEENPDADVEPTLSFIAYAIQQEKFTTAEDAWLELNP